ncbi:MAG: DNA polymerase III subunit gamma/tau [Azospirillaceae bacterium]|nr:DNA polymerase III subunit gamma/tau [Azospirillaceae bacterium]
MSDTTIIDTTPATTPAPLAAAPPPAATPTVAYRVLARKYRPSTFAELIGQEALVRTLTNAIRSGRIAQAFMLTGVRGVGKTTTARIIARALNCIGPDGTGGPTTEPCGHCEHCRAIAQDRHVDVMEMDAASRTSVDDIREIIDGVRYGAVSARYKIYIIDEVHMLSKNAFNALLKTLEEPPPHVKFVFATTEIRKVPVTVLSRCQRFDLRRVDGPTLITHFNRIAAQEAVAVDPDAMALIARAADGSVRDGLSLLDQAIALGGDAVTALQVRDMLGLADRTIIVDLFAAAMSGQPAAALDIAADLHRAGADPLVIVQDLLDFTHFLTRCKVVPQTVADPGIPEAERDRGGDLARKLSMPVLARAWQMLLKGLGEVQSAPSPHQALEMVIIRLAYGANLPTPADLVRQIDAAAASRPPGGSSGGGEGVHGGSNGTGAIRRDGGAVALAAVPRMIAPSQHAEPAPLPVMTMAEPETESAAMLTPVPTSFRALVDLFAEHREGRLYGELFSAVHLVRLEPGMLEIRPSPAASANLANRVSSLLSEWTGRRWIVSVSGAPGEPTLNEQQHAAKARLLEEAARHPHVQAILQAFPGARIIGVTDVESPPPTEPGLGDDDEIGDTAPDPDPAFGFEDGEF